jgi:hypothetical protein
MDSFSADEHGYLSSDNEHVYDTGHNLRTHWTQEVRPQAVLGEVQLRCTPQRALRSTARSIRGQSRSRGSRAELMQRPCHGDRVVVVCLSGRKDSIGCAAMPSSTLSMAPGSLPRSWRQLSVADAPTFHPCQTSRDIAVSVVGYVFIF